MEFTNMIEVHPNIACIFAQNKYKYNFLKEEFLFTHLLLKTYTFWPDDKTTYR